MNKLSDYHILEELLKEKKDELWRLQQEYNSIVQQEPYMRGRLKGRQHTLYKLAGEIKSIEKELRQMEKHTKDAMDMLKLMGWTTDAEYTTSIEKGKLGLWNWYVHKNGTIVAGGTSNTESEARAQANAHLKKESHSTDSCGKVYTKGESTEDQCKDDDATEMGAFEELGQNHETEAMEPEEHPVLAQDDEVGEKFKTVMEEFSKGELESSSGEKVTDPKQAKAIAYSEQREATKDARFEVMYTIGQFHNPETLQDKREIIQANSAGEARRMIENKWKGNLNRIIQITLVHDSDPKVAEANDAYNRSDQEAKERHHMQIKQMQEQIKDWEAHIRRNPEDKARGEFVISRLKRDIELLKGRSQKDSDPKVEEANKLINLFGGAM